MHPTRRYSFFSAIPKKRSAQERIDELPVWTVFEYGTNTFVKRMQDVGAKCCINPLSGATVFSCDFQGDEDDIKVVKV